MAVWTTGQETVKASMLKVDERAAASCATKRATLRGTAHRYMVRVEATPWIVMINKVVIITAGVTTGTETIMITILAAEAEITIAAGVEAHPIPASLPVTAIAEQKLVKEEIIVVAMNPREEGVTHDRHHTTNMMIAVEETIAGKKKMIVISEVEAVTNEVEVARDREISQMIIVINLRTLPRSRLNRRSKGDEH